MRKLPKNVGIKPIVSLRPLRSLRLKTLVRKEQATNGSAFGQTRGSADWDSAALSFSRTQRLRRETCRNPQYKTVLPVFSFVPDAFPV